jgi:hypothetical protein
LGSDDESSKSDPDSCDDEKVEPASETDECYSEDYDSLLDDRLITGLTRSTSFEIGEVASSMLESVSKSIEEEQFADNYYSQIGHDFSAHSNMNRDDECDDYEDDQTI